MTVEKTPNVGKHTTLFFIILVLAFSITISVVNQLFFSLPAVKPANEVPASEFSEERAKQHNTYLVEQIGIRLVGCKENEVDAVNYILDQLNEIKTLDNNEGPIIEVSVQKATGSRCCSHVGERGRQYTGSDTLTKNNKYTPSPSIYRDNFNHYLEYISTDQSDLDVKSHVNVGYQERQTKDIKQKRNALLISSHFDTNLGSPGASDDGAPLGVMLELIRVLANNPALPTPVIFNFNGGEEPGMQASFGFLQHPWAKTVRSVINLESCGSGGKEILFQTGPGNGWLVEAYAKVVKNPSATAAAQDIFQRIKAVPGDTDFIVYRDLGDIPGIDFAFIYNGYVYHTRYDDINHINKSIGSMQNMGQNVLDLIRELSHNYFSKDDVMASLDVKSEVVYFDVLSFFVVVYSMDMAPKMYLAYFVALFTIYFYQLRQRQAAKAKEASVSGVQFDYGLPATLRACLDGYIAALVGAVSAILYAVFIVFVLNKRMTWFSSASFAFTLYSIPTLLGVCIYYTISRRRLRCKISDSVDDASFDQFCNFNAFWGGQLILATVTMLASLGLGFAVAYVWFVISVTSVASRFILVPVTKAIFSFIASAMPSEDAVHFNQFVTMYAEVVVIIFCTTALDIYHFYKLYMFYIPLMGRTGTVVEADIIVAGLTALLAITLLLYNIVPMMHKYARFSSATAIAFTALVVTTVVMVALSGSVLTPYTKDTPKRIHAQHSFFLDNEGKVSQSYLLTAGTDSLPIEHDLIPEEFSGLESVGPDVLQPNLETFYPFANFLSEAKRLTRDQFGVTPSNSHEEQRPVAKVQPSVQMTADDFSIATNGSATTAQRKMRFIMHPGRDECWANIKLEAKNIASWSLTKQSLPPQSPPGYFMIRKIGMGSLDFEVTLEKQVDAATAASAGDAKKEIFGDFPVVVSSTCFVELSESIRNLDKMMPEWCSAEIHETFIRTYVA